MKKFAFVFPGQGSQKLNMGLDFFENFTLAKQIIEEASDIVNIDILNVVKDEQSLKDAVNTQVALFTVSIAILECLKKEKPLLSVDFYLGHSLGEYTSLVVSGVLNFKDSLLLIKKRAELMKECTQKVEGSMAAVIGVERDFIENLVENTKINNEILVCANYNSKVQTVVSGEVQAVARLVQKAKEQGVKAVLLPVAGAFHSPLMEFANSQLQKYIENTSFSKPKTSFISSQNTEIVLNENIIKENLKNQIISKVDWVGAVNTAIKNKATHFVEVGSGQVLCGLIAKIDESVHSKPINDISSFENFLSDKLFDNN
jgi:[acyl-carrier-protein] S-malonyltransferase